MALRVDDLIDKTLLEAFFEEWMGHPIIYGAQFVNAVLSGKTITITDRQNRNRTISFNGTTITFNDGTNTTSLNIKGDKGDKGDGFNIYRTYASISAMNADASNVPEGRMVMIVSNVEDVDNAKVYVKDSGGFNFFIDLSGAQGIKGEPFRYSDFTQEQISELQTPATEAAAYIKNDWEGSDGRGGLKVTVTSWYNSTVSTWNDWFSSTLTTGVRKLWNDFWSSINSSWSSFFGTSADDTNGVRKIWSTWYQSTQTAWNNWFSDSLADGVRKKWENFWDGIRSSWNGFFGSTADDPNGVRNIWSTWFSDTLADGVRKKWNDFWSSINSSWTGFFGSSSEDANGVRKIWSTWYQNIQVTWTAWFSDSISTGVRKLWNDFWYNINTRWENFFGEESGTPTKGVQKIWTDWFSDSLSIGTRKLWNDFWSNINTRWENFFGEESGTVTKGVQKIWNDWFGADNTQGVQGDWKEISDECIDAANFAISQGDYAKEQGDRCEVLNDHPQEIRSDGYIWAWNEATEQMVNTLRRIVATLDISSLTQQQKQELMEQFVLNPATLTEAQAIANGTKTSLTTEEQTKVWREETMLAYHSIIAARIQAIEDAKEPVSTAGQMWSSYYLRN